MKYFVIGFNKTATTTFHNLFIQNDLKSQHASIWNTNNFNCFSDNGDLNNYKLLDIKYENSIFILNIRRLDKWLISRFKHGQSHKLKSKWAYPATQELCNNWINQRERYYMEILKYFKKKPDKLIIVSIDEPEWISYICNQLNFKNNNIKSINIRKTSETKHKNILDIVNKTFKKLKYDTFCKQNILFVNKELTEKYLKIFRNNII